MSAGAEGREPWAQLVSTTDVDSAPVSINKDKFTIGRRAGDMTFPENKLVSSSHCSLFREPTTGKVFLQDTSTNGTMINNTKVGKGQKWELNHGDEIHIVFKKNNTEQNIAYLFQDLAKLKEEEQDESLLDVTQEYGSDTEGSTIDYTLPNTEMGSEASNVSGASGGAKRQMEEVSESEPVSKKAREETKQGDMQQKTSSDTGVAVPASATGGAASTSAAQQDSKDTAEKEDTTLPRGDSQVAGPSSEKSAAGCKDDKPKPPPRDEMEETLLCGVCQDILHDCISLQPCMHSFCAGCYSQWMDMSNLCPSCRNKVDRISKNHIVNNLVQVYLKDHPEKKRSEEDLAELNKKNKITDDMLYPKHGHHRREYESYSDEYSDSDSGHEDASLSGGSTPRGWRAYYSPYGMHHVSTRPPPRTICRQCPDYAPPTSATTGAQVTGTLVTPPVSTGIATSPVRMGEEITLYDPRVVGPTVVSTVTQVMQQPPTGVAGVPAPVSMGQGISMYDPRVLGSSSAPPAPDPAGTAQTPGVAVTAATATAVPGAAAPTTARTDSTVSTSSQASQVTDSSPEERARRLAGPRPPPPEPCQFVCQVNQNHVMCQCCWKPMPDRTRETPPSPPQKCSLCHRVFCHMYWGCNNPRCLGCLNNFKDLYFDGRCLNDLINNNHYESSIFMNYLDDKNLTLRDVLQTCMEKLAAGEYTVTDPNSRPSSPLTPDTVICYTCGLRNFRQLAYQYRSHIPRDQLPAEATSRPDCYWGRNCRTQHSKPHHAKNFSHICEQTRFT